FKPMSILELDNLIDDLIDKDLVKREGSQSFKKLMGPVMAKVRGKMDGETVAKRLNKKIQDLLNNDSN
ncbi:MAG: GatB/YqeY domain-containing protein, partial [Candidatus Aenigmarchaeota archaeon]|nr:GatB/YqeY domain-containing protein [Candidatus Aenigmarchaeota archaeon]